jgi:hypothetical protein
MVRELLQPRDEGESGPTELENRYLVPSLEILGGIVKKSPPLPLLLLF